MPLTFAKKETVQCEKGTITPKRGFKSVDSLGNESWMVGYDYTGKDVSAFKKAGLSISPGTIMNDKKDCDGLMVLANDMKCDIPKLMSAILIAYDDGDYAGKFPDFSASCPTGISAASPRRFSFFKHKY